jgi:hypothetical protein
VGGGTNKTPVWTAVGEGQAACGTCHGLPPPLPHPEVEYDLTLCAVCHSDTLDPGGGMIPPAEGGLHLDGLVEASGHEPSWMDTASEDFHAFSANRGLGSCATCHGIDLGGGVAQTACADCHGATWRTNCTMCHGGDDNITGAPPRTTWGQGDDPIRVGAHTHHVGGGAIGGPYDCDVCHVTPPDALAADHIGGPYAGVVFSGLALQGGAAPVYTWSRAGTPEATCASTYCHGNYSGTYTYWVYDEEKFAAYAGKAATASWIGGPMGCDSCHDNPPRTTGVWHSGYHSGGNDCQLCHPDAAGVNGVGTSITVRASHVNGIVDIAPKWRSSCLRACH